MRSALLVLLVITLGCSGSEEPAPSLIAEARRAAEVLHAQRPGGSPTPAGARARPPYVPRSGIHIDMPHLAGADWASLAEDFIAAQLGEIQSREVLAGEQEHIIGQKAEVWLHRGRVYRVRKPLEHVMDIPTALGTSGFPLSLGTPQDGNGEIRWNRAWNMRWIKLKKTAEDPRRFDVIEVEAFSPYRRR